jgi:hypothetical protein
LPLAEASKPITSFTVTSNEFETLKSSLPLTHELHSFSLAPPERVQQIWADVAAFDRGPDQLRQLMKECEAQNLKVAFVIKDRATLTEDSYAFKSNSSLAGNSI